MMQDVDSSTRYADGSVLKQSKCFADRRASTGYK